jgi:hypothetical protein
MCLRPIDLHKMPVKKRTFTLFLSPFVCLIFLVQSSSFTPSRSSRMAIFHSTVSETFDPLVKTNSSTLSSNDVDYKFDLPWSDLQDWALRDSIHRYTIQVPVVDSESKRTTLQVCTLWRSLYNDVTELSGYPLDFLVQQRALQVRNEQHNDNVTATGRDLVVVGKILPYLDDFVFANSGGLSGCVYGMAGVADGMRIETAPVSNVQATIPKGFVMTQDASVIYELGRPLSALQENTYSLDGILKQRAIVSARSLTKSALGTLDDAPLDPEIVNLGILTAIVVTGALAFETLSHHLTVNVFWV